MFAWLDELTAAADEARERIFAAESYLWKHPATGYREWEASGYLADEFRSLGYTLTMAGDIPGFYADIDTGRPGPRAAILGELDSVLCSSHPEADPETGAVHACGHHAQGAALLGVAAILRRPGILAGLSGGIRLIAVPAEELLELGYREQLRRQGVIRYFGGKAEFLYRGYFDGVDMAMMLHTGGPAGTMTVHAGNNGCILKNLTYTGKAAHAGGAPHQGVNALYAASLGMQAVNSLRETFREDDYIRVHPIVTDGGAAVNVIPAEVTLESYVRGATVEAIRRENRKVNRAFAGAAAAMGAGLTIADRPGYMPLHNDANLVTVARDVMEAVAGPGHVNISAKWDTGCTDMGDISCVMPAIQPMMGGSEGQGHGADYRISDRESACVLAAKVLAGTACALLMNETVRAHKVMKKSQVLFKTFDDYLQAVDAIVMDRDAVAYGDDGTVTLDFGG